MKVDNFTAREIVDEILAQLYKWTYIDISTLEPSELSALDDIVIRKLEDKDA